MTNKTELQPKQGKMHTIVSALKSLLLEDPLIFIIVVAFLLPLAGITYDSVVKLDIAMALFAILISFVIVILVLIPLIIFRNNKQHSNELQKMTKASIKAESQTRLEAEKTNTSIKFQLMLAKINHIEAETDFILSQSDRHEKRLLEEAGKEISEAVQKDFDKLELVKRDECKDNVTVVIAALRKQEDQYDAIIDKFTNLTAWLETISDTKLPDPQPKITVVKEVKDPVEQTPSPPLSDSAKEQIDSLKAVIKNKNEDIDGLVKDLEGGSKNYNELQADYDKVKAQLEAEKAKDSITERIKKKVSLSEKGKSFFISDNQFLKKEPVVGTESPLKDALKVLDNITDPTDETEPAESKEEESLDLASDQQNNEFKPYSIQGIPILEKQANPVVWVCKCKRENEISRLRCISCGAGKPIISITNSHSF